MAEKITRPAEPLKTCSSLLYEHMAGNGYTVELDEDTPNEIQSSLVYPPHTPYLPEKVAS